MPMRLVDTLMHALLKMSGTPLNYWAGFAVDIPLGAVLLGLGLRVNERGPGAAVLAVAAGLFLFSIIEYSFHRWLMHGSVQLFAQGHRSHHADPLGYDALPFFFPALLFLTCAGMIAPVLPASAVLLLVGSIQLGYVAYGLGHFTIHHHRFQYAPARNWAAHHLVHHYHPDANFGVTTPLWDVVLGTSYVYDHKKY